MVISEKRIAILVVRFSFAISSSTSHYEKVPSEVPKSWVWCRLGEIGTWQSGATPSRLRKDYYGGDIPWLKTGDLNDGYIDEIPERITRQALVETSVKLNPTGSILMAMYGATIGKVGILTYPATTNQACCACIDYEAIVPLYLFYFLLANRANFIRMGGGGAQPNISKEKIVETHIPLPPFSEQHRIVAEIERWFVIIDQLEQNQSDLQTAIKQTKMKVLDLAIHGKLVPQDPNDEPASELLKRINPKAVATSDTHHYEKVPKGWSVCHLNEIADIALGKTLDKQRNKGDYMPYLRSVNVRWGYTELSDIKEMRFEPSEIDRYKVIRGDLLICEGGEAGRSAVWEGIDIQYQNAIHRVRFKDKIDPYFYMYSLHYYSENHFLENFCKGVTIKHLTGQALKQISFPLPPLAEQKRIVDKIAQIFAQLDIIVAEL